ncbi:nucleoside-diphosphate-sugar epimerase [Sediminihabitans luteus]|uniref:Nucleoside-diphosphate-sugar epimerase n=1 Tax=Sediminihabitans luteus TaxID=1138585 RepID=A0A2M9D0Y0_9CELL|nr:NAD-dependent epimerase/dehydratase family protein [Sediminihabitans luteus]PJJ77829.1 nucleoside-diphosphate-sugar epimerase [Sediminihabitans luteus]GII99813.1 reductase [Sediminihabitans luteus]
MRLLVLGGTRFLGRALVDDALARGWDVTVLHRGSAPLPAGWEAVTDLHGDRTTPGGLDALDAPTGGQDQARWDVVVDTWSWAPSAVRDAARALADRADRYVYVSSRSVYDAPARGAREDWPLVDGSPDDGADVPYPRLKRGGEIAAVEVFDGRATVVRPGVILGPHEDVGRLPWWLARAARGGRILAPRPRRAEVQYVDARDLARFTLDVAPRGGVYDVVGPAGTATMRTVLEECVRATATARRRAGAPEAELCWVDPEDVLAAGIAPWTDLPLWLPPGPDHDALHGADVSTALDAGLRVRGLDATVRDTWAWLESVGEAPSRAGRPRLGLDPDVEARVLGPA